MKGFKRENRLLSLCGLNCGLCTMYLGKYCPGCGGGEGNQPCAMARCSLQHPGRYQGEDGHCQNREFPSGRRTQSV